MEEIKGTQVLEREILEDAGKRAEKILRKARDEAQKILDDSATTLAVEVEALGKNHDAKVEALTNDVLSRLPLEKARLKVQFIDHALTDAVAKMMDSLGDELFGQWCCDRLEKYVGIVGSRPATIACKGIGASFIQRLKTLLAGNPAARIVDDESLPYRGIFVRTDDDSLKMSITTKQLEEWLLDDQRGELAKALFPIFPGTSGDGASARASSLKEKGTRR